MNEILAHTLAVKALKRTVPPATTPVAFAVRQYMKPQPIGSGIWPRPAVVK